MHGEAVIVANFHGHLLPLVKMCSKLDMWFVPGGLPEDVLDQLIRDASLIMDVGSRIDFISRRFLGTPYRGATLIGDLETPEVFVINLREMDCLTFLEYVEAMRRSASFMEFQNNLLRVRYRCGSPLFVERNHFFTDWAENEGFIRDVTGEVGGSAVLTVDKTLNMRADGTFFLPGIEPRRRTLHYIPASSLTADILGRLRTGDYIGVYTEEAGLDVSHAGIVIRNESSVLLRHASSLKKYQRVVDQDLGDYLSGRPGIIVLRPLEPSPASQK